VTALTKNSRRQFLVGLIPHVVKACLHAGKHVNPATIITGVLTEQEWKGREIFRGEDAVRAILSDIQNLRIVVENETLSFTLDKVMTLETIGSYLRGFYADEGSLTSSFQLLHDDSTAGHEFDGELKLPARSIYVKLFTSKILEDLSFYLLKARMASPSEYWLISLTGEEVDVPLTPTFLGENKVLFTRFRCLTLKTLLRRFLGVGYEVSVQKEGDGIKVDLNLHALSEAEAV
jgi:hypothetical protein